MKKKSGYTLIELIVAMAVFGILIIPISNMIMTIIDINKKAENNIDIASIMSQVYEEKIGEINASETVNEGSTEASYGTDGKYKIKYSINKIHSSNISGIQNDKSDINMVVDENKFIKINNTKIMGLIDGENDIYIKVSFVDDKKIRYEIENKSNSSDVLSIEINNPNFGIYFNGEKITNLPNINLNIIIDGIYKDGTSLANKSLTFNNKKLEDSVRDKIKTLSTSPYVLICDIEENTPTSNVESTYEMKVDIIDAKSEDVLKSQTYYFTKRLK
jgi:prepilin-type N-terminal cleavage/methylation domain-containing protein